MTPSPRARWTAALGLIVSGAFLWWAVRDVAFAEVIEHLAGVRWTWLSLSIAVATLTFPLRTIRWRYLLRLEGAPLPFAPLWHATAVGFMANNVLPARAGEFARAWMAQRLTGVKFTTAFASIAVERILDGITLVAMLLLATALGGFDPATRIGGATLGGVATGAALLFGAVLAVALATVRWPHHALRAAERLVRAILPTTVAERLVGMIGGLVEGLDALGSPGRAAWALAWSAVVWATAAASFWLAFRAFDIAVPWSAALMLQSLMAFGVALPSAPGFAGVFEAVAKAALLLYGVAETPAVSLALGYHLGTWIPIVALGFWSLAGAGLRISDLRGDGTREVGDGRREMGDGDRG